MRGLADIVQKRFKLFKRAQRKKSELTLTETDSSQLFGKLLNCFENTAHSQ